MSIYSDYKVGALSDEEYDSLCAWENRKDRYERDHEGDEDQEEVEE